MRLAVCDICGQNESFDTPLDRIYDDGEWFDVCVQCQIDNNGPVRLKIARKDMLRSFGNLLENLL